MRPWCEYAQRMTAATNPRERQESGASCSTISFSCAFICRMCLSASLTAAAIRTASWRTICWSTLTAAHSLQQAIMLNCASASALAGINPRSVVRTSALGAWRSAVRRASSPLWPGQQHAKSSRSPSDPAPRDVPAAHVARDLGMSRAMFYRRSVNLKG